MTTLCAPTAPAARGLGPRRAGRSLDGRASPRSRPARPQPGDQRLAGARAAAGDAEPAQPRLPAGDGGHDRAPRAGRRQLLDLARAHVPLPRRADARRRRGDRGARLRRDAGGRLRQRRRVPLPAPPARRRALRRSGRARASHRRRGRRDRHRPDAAAGALQLRRRRRPRRSPAASGASARPRRLPPPARGRASRRCPPTRCSAWRRTRCAPTHAGRARGAARGRPDGPLHIHVAEQVQRGRARSRPGSAAGRSTACSTGSGSGPALVPDPLHADDRRRDRAASPRPGRSPGLCPITEANLGDGIFPGAV